MMLNVDIDPMLILQAQSAALVVECCKIANMDDVQIIVKFTERKKTTMGVAWTHYGPHQKHPEYIYRGSGKKRTKIKNPLYCMNGKSRGGIILLATKLYQRATKQEQKETTIHEAAHILTNLKAGQSVGHGPAWMRMMVNLGCEPERLHRVDTAGLRQRRYRIECACGWFWIISASKRTRIANRIKSGTHYYRCPKCSETLKENHFRNSKEVK